MGGSRRWKLKRIIWVERKWQKGKPVSNWFFSWFFSCIFHLCYLCSFNYPQRWLLLLFYRWEKLTLRFINRDHPAKHIGPLQKHSFGVNETLELEFWFPHSVVSLGSSYELLYTSVSLPIKWELHYLPHSGVVRTK